MVTVVNDNGEGDRNVENYRQNGRSITMETVVNDNGENDRSVENGRKTTSTP